jgi:hypothetical protein
MIIRIHGEEDATFDCIVLNCRYWTDDDRGWELGDLERPNLTKCYYYQTVKIQFVLSKWHFVYSKCKIMCGHFVYILKNELYKKSSLFQIHVISSFRQNDHQYQYHFTYIVLPVPVSNFNVWRW